MELLGTLTCGRRCRRRLAGRLSGRQVRSGKGLQDGEFADLARQAREFKSIAAGEGEVQIYLNRIPDGRPEGLGLDFDFNTGGSCLRRLVTAAP